MSRLREKLGLLGESLSKLKYHATFSFPERVLKISTAYNRCNESCDFCNLEKKSDNGMDFD